MTRTLTRLLIAGSLAGTVLGWPLAGLAETAADSPPPAVADDAAMPGAAAVDADALETLRGGAEVASENVLVGTVQDNHASHLATGYNVIREGSFAGTSGIPVVIQNSGNNVLIQNATIVNMHIQ